MFTTLKSATAKWSEHGLGDRVAALTFYSLLAFPPLIILALNIAKYALSTAETDNIINSFIGNFPAQSEDFIMQFMDQVVTPELTLTSMVSIFFLLYTAGNFVFLLENVSNKIFESHVKPSMDSFSFQLRRRGISLSVLLLFFCTALASLLGFSYIELIVPWFPSILFENFTSIFVYSIFFTLLLKWIVYVRLTWRDAMQGALILSTIAVVGKVALGYVFQIIPLASSFTVGASIVLFMLWINYMLSALLFGLELIAALYRTKYQGTIPTKSFALSTYQKDYTPLLHTVAKTVGTLITLAFEIKTIKWIKMVRDIKKKK